LAAVVSLYLHYLFFRALLPPEEISADTRERL
jgi:hypothetical protein